MAVVQTAMLAGLPYTALRDAILTHPTMAEGLARSSPASSTRRNGERSLNEQPKKRATITHTERKNEADGATRILNRRFQVRLMQGPRRQRS